MTLNGKRIVLLGGSSGIGLATAQAAGGDGARLVIASSRQTSLDAALATLPAGTQGHVLDLTKEDQIRAFFAEVGAFDHLVYTAGENLELGPIAQTDIAAAQRFWAIRYWGAYMAVKYGAPAIQKSGSIVLTSGLAGNRPHPGWTVAASICTAMQGLARALAVELAPVRVNLVMPGVVKTPLWDNMSAADREAFYRQMEAALLVGHVGEPEEIAEAYLYLMRQTYGTGETLTVDGGGALV